MTAFPPRRTVSGGGRPRKAGPREPNGDLQRPSREETTAEIISIAIAQPHRRGSADPRRRWAIGRLLLDGKVIVPEIGAAKLEQAANRYAADYHRLKRALLSKRPLAVTGGKKLSPEDPERDEREYAEALAAWSDVTRALKDADERVRKALDFAVLDAAPDADERCFPFWVVHSLAAGLAIIAGHYGVAE